MRDIQEYLEVAEVAQETGLSESFWRKNIFYKQISYLKAGRRVVIRRSDLDKWIAARMVPAVNHNSNRRHASEA